MRSPIATLFIGLWLIAFPQDNAFNSGRDGFGHRASDEINGARVNTFNDAREKLNVEYVKMTRERWGDFNLSRGMDNPMDRDRPVAPIVDDDTSPIQGDGRQVIIDGIVTPIINEGGPQPVAPMPTVEDDDVNGFISFMFLNTSFNVRRPASAFPRLNGVGENDVADAWYRLGSNQFGCLIRDCLALRTSIKLCDWAYLQMLLSLANAIYPNHRNEAILLTAYLYSQSGYQVRMARCGNQLDLMYATKHMVYNKPYVEIDGFRYFSLTQGSGYIQICQAHYPREQLMSLWVPTVPKVDYRASGLRNLKSSRYPEFSVSVSVNENLMSFFNTYPTSEVGGDMMTRWAMYANTPLYENTLDQLYPQMRQMLAGMSEYEAVSRILNWVQTAFVYEYDDKVWGRDRAFFPEETLYYPYCDCEDRSILFTRLVRDLVGLRCAFIFYPGHLAAAVCFNENVAGDYLMLKGQRYTVCDPTYINAPVGRTMPDMNNSTAKAMPL